MGRCGAWLFHDGATRLRTPVAFAFAVAAIGSDAAAISATAAEAADHFVELKVNEKTKIKHLTNKRWLQNPVTQSTTSTLPV